MCQIEEDIQDIFKSIQEDTHSMYPTPQIQYINPNNKPLSPEAYMLTSGDNFIYLEHRHHNNINNTF